jgi:hypothetical protein
LAQATIDSQKQLIALQQQALANNATIASLKTKLAEKVAAQLASFEGTWGGTLRCDQHGASYWNVHATQMKLTLSKMTGGTLNGQPIVVGGDLGAPGADYGKAGQFSVTKPIPASLQIMNANEKGLVHLAILPLLLLVACTRPAATGSCAQARVVDLPFSDFAQIPTIDADIGRQQVRLALSGIQTMPELSPSAAQRLHLPTFIVESKPNSPGVKPVTFTLLQIPHLDIGRIHFANLAAMERPTRLRFHGSSPDGSLAIGKLKDFSLDFDLPHGRFSLAQDSACNRKTYSFTGSVTIIGMRTDRYNRPAIPVALDGKTYTAILDPSLAGIAISARAAGLARPVDSRQLPGNDAKAGQHIWAHRFGELQIGADRLRHPKLVVIEHEVPGADMIIGFPYFHFRRIILSMPDRRVYIEAPRPGSEPKTIPAPVRGSSVT